MKHAVLYAPDSSSVRFVSNASYQNVGADVGRGVVGADVGIFVGLFVGDAVDGLIVGDNVGVAVGGFVGMAVGVFVVGLFVGAAVGLFVGDAVGILDGIFVGKSVGATVKPAGNAVGVAVGFFVGVGVGACSTTVASSIVDRSTPAVAAATAVLSCSLSSLALESFAASSGSAACCVICVSAAIVGVFGKAITSTNLVGSTVFSEDSRASPSPAAIFAASA